MNMYDSFNRLLKATRDKLIHESSSIQPKICMKTYSYFLATNHDILEAMQYSCDDGTNKEK